MQAPVKAMYKKGTGYLLEGQPVPGQYDRIGPNKRPYLRIAPDGLYY